MKNDPTSIKITKEEDFPPETKLEDGEGMLPKEQPVKRMGGQGYTNRQQQRPQYMPGPARPTPQGLPSNQQIPWNT